MWDYPQEKYFKRVKELLTQAPILLYYDPARPTVVSADVSSYGLRAALFQEIDSNLKITAFASHSIVLRGYMHKLREW